ncbi:hypothetical protein WKI65_38195 [Streptomyces sp. MS1.AVA.3]|uniref:hypothetical protein n=1 Tax=Streptomyces decoyicus TaxID=249567 RepID=UPI0030BB460E
MPPARFTDPELQALYDYLAPAQRTRTAGAASAEAIAAREGLNLTTELAALRRPAPARPAHTPRHQTRPAQHSHVLALLRAHAPRMRATTLQTKAAAWAQLRMCPHETGAWIKALGVDGAATAAACRRLGIGLPAMDITLDGQTAARRLRGGETPTAIHARAATLGITLPG